MIKNIKGERDQDKTDPHDAIIWNNSDIKIEGQPIFYKSWHKVGINKVKHLLQQGGRKPPTKKFIYTRLGPSIMVLLT